MANVAEVSSRCGTDSEFTSFRKGVENRLRLSEMSDSRNSLLAGLKEQLLKGYVSTSQAENNRNQALRILSNRMARMPDDMLLNTIRELSEIGALDMTAATETLVPGGRTPLDSIQQEFGRLRGGSQPRPTSNPFKDAGDLLEALEHIARYFRDKAPHQTERGREGG
jgi:hypothetical protein